MSDATAVADLCRELMKAYDVLGACRLLLARKAEANAALHCAERVMYSPLHARVDAVMGSVAAAEARYRP